MKKLNTKTPVNESTTSSPMNRNSKTPPVAEDGQSFDSSVLALNSVANKIKLNFGEKLKLNYQDQKRQNEDEKIS